MLKLVVPSTIYKKSFLEAVEEIKADADVSSKWPELKATPENFDEILSKWDKDSKGIDLGEGRVQQTILWLVDGDEFIGRLSLRHELNEQLRLWGGHVGYLIRPTKRQFGYGSKILELGLVEAKKLGFKKVLIGCNKNNIPSKKIIEKNGGVFEKECHPEGEKEVKLTFWIEIK